MTDKEFGELILGMTVLIDTREQKNDHIIEYLIRSGIPYKRVTLNHGDYSFEFSNPEYKYLDRSVCIEKKNSLDEINGNFTTGRDRFHREFQRAKEAGTKMHLVIENATWKKIVNESYRSKISSASVTASILSFSIRYDCPVWFCGKEESAMLIYKLLVYSIREKVYKSF